MCVFGSGDMLFYEMQYFSYSGFALSRHMLGSLVFVHLQTLYMLSIAFVNSDMFFSHFQGQATGRMAKIELSTMEYQMLKETVSKYGCSQNYLFWMTFLERILGDK